MAVPKIMISSTCYDLKETREHLEIFIRNMGYNPIRSDKGDIGYNITETIKADCYFAAQQCDILVGIIGGTFGGMESEDDSVTMREIKTALACQKQVYIFVYQNVLTEFRTYKKNLENKGEDFVKKEMMFTSVSDPRIFDFINDMYAHQSERVVIEGFGLATEISAFLKKQWANLFHIFLNQKECNRKNEANLKTAKFSQEKCTNIDLCHLRFLADQSFQKGDQEYRKGNNKAALRHYKEAESYYKDSNDKINHANTLLCMGIIEATLEKHSREAVKHLLSAYPLLAAEGEHFDAGALKKAAAIQARNGQYESARDWYSLGEEKCLEKGDYEELATIFRLRGIMEGKPELNNINAAQDYLNRANEKYVELSNILGQAQTFQSIGDLNREHGKYLLAIENYEEAQDLYNMTNDIKGQSIIIGELCRAYALAGKNDTAKIWVKEIESKLEKMPEDACDYVTKCLKKSLDLLGMDSQIST